MNHAVNIARSPTTVNVLGLVSIVVAAYGLTTHNPFHAILCAVPALAASLCALIHTLSPPEGERTTVFALFIPVFLLLALKQMYM